MPSPVLTEKIRKEIIDSGVDDRYRVGAYEFVLNGLNFYHSKIGERRRVGGRELSKGLLMYAGKQYGPMAQSVFDHWGIKGTDDFGNVIYNMISIGMMSKQPGDSLDDFFDAADVPRYFKTVNYFEVDREFIKKKA